MKAIVAADPNWAIGRGGDLLAHVPEDMKFFRQTTLGSAVVMGRKTLDSFPGGRPLPKRRNIVLTRDPDFSREGVEVVHDVAELTDLLAGCDTEVFVIGGGEIYSLLLPLCEQALVTRFEKEFPADTWFPNLESLEEWTLEESSSLQQSEETAFRFTTWKRAK